MSRIGRKPITIPESVKVDIVDNNVTISGPKGTLTRSLPSEVAILVEDNTVRLSADKSLRFARAQHGLQRQLIQNMVTGVSEGYCRVLEVVGMGYRVSLGGKNLTLNVGFSHPVEVTPPEGITFQVEGNNKISVIGVDNQLVGEVAARIKSYRPPEPYKGKGIRYAGEVIRRKAGKSGKAAK